MVTNTSLELDKLRLHRVTVRSHSLMNVKEIEAAEKAKITKKINKMLAFKPDVVVSRTLIYDW